MFGPESVTWRIPGDPSMLVGGFRALLLQAVHPLVMAGFDDNSVFRAVKASTPGPYTFILPATGEVPRKLLHAKKRTVGVRIPEHPVVRALLAELGEPMLTSTLILPGETEPMTDGWQVKEELDHVVDVVIDSGECGTEPTTVVDFSSGAAEVVRVGSGDPSRFE